MGFREGGGVSSTPAEIGLRYYVNLFLIDNVENVSENMLSLDNLVHSLCSSIPQITLIENPELEIDTFLLYNKKCIIHPLCHKGLILVAI